VFRVSSYVDLARAGYGRWWRYVMGLVFVMSCWLIVGGVATAIVLAAVLQPGTALTALNVEQLSAQGPYSTFLVVMAGYPFFLLGMLLVPLLFHRRSPRTLITAAPSINWGRAALGFGVWSGIQVLFTVLGYLLDPAGLMLTLNPTTFGPFLLMAVCLIPLQSTAEELLFRGYLVQWASLLSRNRVFLTVVSGVLFTLPHLANPEVGLDVPAMVAQYFALGAFFAWISLRDGTLELAIGVHAANNLFAVLLVNYPNSALPSPSLFTATSFEPLPSLIWLLIGIALFYVAVYVRPERRARVRPGI
jgi:membrane protease YdiL (CAAX protease family)